MPLPFLGLLKNLIFKIAFRNSPWKTVFSEQVLAATTQLNNGEKSKLHLAT